MNNDILKFEKINNQMTKLTEHQVAQVKTLVQDELKVMKQSFLANQEKVKSLEVKKDEMMATINELRHLNEKIKQQNGQSQPGDLYASKAKDVNVKNYMPTIVTAEAIEDKSKAKK